MERRAHEHVEPGGERYLDWARARLAALAAHREAAGLPALSRNWILDGSLVRVKSTDWGDLIRITAQSGTVSLLVNAALAAFEVPAELLDAGEEDFGLVLPKDVSKLPGSFKKGTLDPSRTPPYRGMIVNHAFRDQHPSQYTDISTYLTPISYAPVPPLFRYFPDLNGGTFVISAFLGLGEDPGNPFESTAWTLVWISGANANAGANLTVVRKHVQPYDFVTGSPDLFYGYLQPLTVGQDGVVGVGQNFIVMSAPFPSTARLILYKPDGTTQTLIETSGGSAIPARDGADHYLAVTTEVVANAFYDVKLLSASGTIASESLSVFSAGTLGAKVKWYGGGLSRGYIVPYQTSDNPNIFSLYALTHQGTKLLLLGDTFNNGWFPSTEIQMDINEIGTPAVMIPGIVAGSAATHIKVGDGDVLTLASNNGAEMAGFWTPDSRYFLALVSNTLYVFSGAGVNLGSVSVVIGALSGGFATGSSSVGDDGTITGSYKLTFITGSNGVHTISISTIEATGQPFSVTVGTDEIQGADHITYGIDDTRRSYS